jgi:hypothetical protein
MQQSMVTDKESSNQQCMPQDYARWGKERYKEAYNLTEHNNKQQHTIRTKTPPNTDKAHSCTRMPSAEPLVRAAERPGSTQTHACCVEARCSGERTR